MAMETQHSSHSCQDSSATTGKSWKTREGETEGERKEEEGRTLRKGERECVKNVRGKQGFFVGICFGGREAFPPSFLL